MKGGITMKGILTFVLLTIVAASLVFAAQGAQTGLDDDSSNESGQGSMITTEQGVGERVVAFEADGVKLRSRDILLNMTQETIQNRTRFNVQLSNGRNAEIKIMPSTASETALARLRLKVCNESNNCTIQLKEVGSGNETRAAYEVQLERHSRILGIFAKKMQVQTQVDAENGEVVQTKKPWWAFLATEPAE